MIRELMGHKYLFYQLLKKDILDKYKISILGWLWSILQPLFMLAIYTFFFSVIFEVRWGANTGDRYQFALTMFCGLTVFNVLSEVMNRSTTLIVSNISYVKKVIFPLDLLPVVITSSAVFQSLIGFLILVFADSIIHRSFSPTVFEALVLYIPLVCFVLGISYIISSLCVFLRDIGNAIALIITILMYVSPVFFSIDNVPEQFRVFCFSNPLTYQIENFRNVLLYGTNINALYFMVSLVTAILFYFVGRVCFFRLKDGFADVL